MQDFRKLEVWQKAYKLSLDIYRFTIKFPNEEKFGLTSQMRRAAISICSNLAEGCGRSGDADFARFIQIAFGSACELECQILISSDLGFMAKNDQSVTEQQLIEIKCMLASLLKKLRAES